MPHSESWDELEFFLRSDSVARALYMTNYNMDRSKNAGSVNFYSQALEIISPRNLINLSEKTFQYWGLGFSSYTAQPDVLKVDPLGNKPHPLREFPISF